ncbi:MAG: glycosyltransferase family 2 protein [Puniceicoccaceae bacterium]
MRPSTGLSIIIPVCNEAETLKPLANAIREVVETKVETDYEILFVDDGSTDQSWTIIEELRSSHPPIQGIRHRRNLGKAAALQTGFDHARGEVVITMDADLQDEPLEIPAFLAKIEEGYQCVSGWKKLRQDPWTKTVPSRFFNWATRAASGVRLHDFNCGFKAYTRDAIATLNLYGELHRYIPVLLDAEGFQITEIPVQHHRRTHGVSKYGWGRLIKGALDLVTVVMITRYLRRPGHFFGGFGILSGSIGLSILATLSFQKIFFGLNFGTRPLFFLGILLLLFGAQLLSIGLLGELIQYHSRRIRDPRKLLSDH